MNAFSLTHHDIIPPDLVADVDRAERKKLSDKVETMGLALLKVCNKNGIELGSLDKDNIDKYPRPLVMAVRYKESAQEKLSSYPGLLPRAVQPEHAR